MDTSDQGTQFQAFLPPFPSVAEAPDVAIRRRKAKREADAHRRTIRRRFAAGALCVLLAVLAVIVIARAAAVGEKTQTYTPAPLSATVKLVSEYPLYDPEAEGEDPMEAEKIDTALLEQGYFSDAVPLPYYLQDIMQTECEQWGCPYALALAVAEIESHFDTDTVGAVGEVGIMQLNPGPSGSYHAALKAATGQEPTTPAGNIAGGAYMLGQYMSTYADPVKAAMAYNMGEAGAKRAWEAGITTTKYSNNVLAAMERWEAVLG
ncbi:MAG: transglycosylase SLT domain-containing protein [Oscillibacter sp.]